MKFEDFDPRDDEKRMEVIDALKVHFFNFSGLAQEGEVVVKQDKAISGLVDDQPDLAKCVVALLLDSILVQILRDR